jgi:hypothetical protein
MRPIRTFLSQILDIRTLVIIFCAQAIIGSLMYLWDGVTMFSLGAMTLIPFLVYFFKLFPLENSVSVTFTPRIFISAYIFCIICEIGLLANIYLNQTTDSTPSPWMQLGPSFFFLYFATTLLILTTSYFFSNTKWILRLQSIHLFTTWSIAALMYPNGFGFDGQIHRATEEWIKLHGFITPKLPIYIGQYTWVVWFSSITTIPVGIIDIWLVPLFASIILPRVIFQSVVTFFRFSDQAAINLIWFLPFVYFFAFFLTTPFNLLVLLTIIVIFSGLQFAKSKNIKDFLIPGICAIAGLFIHPLLGAPLVLFSGALAMYTKIKNKKLFVVLYGIIMTFLVPCLFMGFILYSRHITPSITNPFNKIQLFLDYWRWPFWYQHTAPWYWNFLYYWEWFIPLLVLALCAYGLYKMRHEINFFYCVSAISLWLSAFFLRSWVVFPDVHALEQGDYPLRLLKGGLLFIVPFGMAGLYFLGKVVINKIQTSNGRRRLTLLLFIFAASALTISFYLTYPQWNPKVRFPGYNVSSADIDAVHWIQKDAVGQDYVVLSNPITATAALKEFSFAKYFKTNQGELFYYSIPSGGVMYNFYTDMWTNGQKRSTMESAMELAGVRHAYFVLPSYWTKFDSIAAGAKKTADRWEAIANGKILIFVYEKK